MACVICGKVAQADLKVFCSVRCQQVDLNRWLTGGYRVPTDETPDPDAPVEPSEKLGEA